jgi:hypothetical protein
LPHNLGYGIKNYENLTKKEIFKMIEEKKIILKK